MNRKKIMDMKPGVDLNLRVAEDVMGETVIMDDYLGWLTRPSKADGTIIWSALLPYSEDVTAADSVIERMNKLGFDTSRWSHFGNGKYTEAEAICKAALLAVMEKQRIEKISDSILEKALGDEPEEAG